MTPEDEFAEHARHWARQTIIFTLQYKLVSHEAEVDCLADLERAGRESAEILNRLWTEAARPRGHLTDTVRDFVRLVLEWSSENLPRTTSRYAQN